MRVRAEFFYNCRFSNHGAFIVSQTGKNVSEEEMENLSNTSESKVEEIQGRKTCLAR